MSTPLIAPMTGSEEMQANTPRQKTDGSLPTINGCNEAYQHADADITLISSDGFHFKVHSYQLMASRGMIHAGALSQKQKEVTFTDERLERSRIVALFLDICYGKPLPPFPHYGPNTYDELEGSLCDLISFLQKYDCRPAIEHLRLYLGSWIKDVNSSPADSLVLAAKLEDQELAMLAIQETGLSEDLDNFGCSTELAYIDGSSNMDLSGMWYDRFIEIPDDYKYALLRGYRYERPFIDLDTTNWEAVAKEFGNVLTAIHNRKRPDKQ
ncbi:hypothetical protein I317_02834 [Kwoniella heveanensis CBS 569]|nr:hypothetical protein I317_02834 [Kwoniella heveanensis CBS 569]